MTQPFYIYNTLTRKKEEFKPLNPPYVWITGGQTIPMKLKNFGIQFYLVTEILI